MDYINRLLNRHSPNKSGLSSPEPETGNEASSNKADQQQHDVKVRFIREFADATGTTVRDGIPESSSLSSASSFQSLASTLSSKCSSGICVDSSPGNNADRSYLSADISGLDDLISACEKIHLDDTCKEQSFELRVDSEENSNDETFTSAVDRASLDRTRENSPINCPNESHGNLNITTEITRDLSPINFSNQADYNLNITTDIIRENSPINCPTEAVSNLNITTEIGRENSSINFQNQENHNLNVTTDITRENLSIKRENQETFDLNVTTDITRENLSINRQNQGNTELNVTTEIASENLAITCQNQGNSDINVTTEIKCENLSINCPNQANSDLNVTREITREDSTKNRSNQASADLNVTTVITRQDLAINPSNQANHDLNVTTNITREDFAINRHNKANPVLDTTGEVTSEDSSINCPIQIDLDTTREITREDLPINCPSRVDLDITREITRENLTINCPNLDLDKVRQAAEQFSRINSESDGQELEPTSKLDGETKASLENSNIVSQTVDLVEANGALSELQRSNETFFQCVSDIAQFSTLNESETALKDIEPALAKTDVSPEISKFTNNKDDDVSKRYVEYSLESITPSISNIRENLCFTEIDEKINKNVTSPAKNLSNLNVEEFHASKQLDNLIEFTKDSQFPFLPTLSTITLPPDIVHQASINNLLADLPKNSPVPCVNKNNQEIPSLAPSISENFPVIAENLSGNSISTIQEPTFIKAQNITDSSNDIRDVETSKFQVSPSRGGNNLEEITNCRALGIEKDAAEESINEELRIEERQVEKSNLSRKLEIGSSNDELLVKKQKFGEQGDSISLELGVTNVEIEKEIFPEIVDKRDNSNEDLDDTVTVEDLSSDDILGVPESVQYAEFVPQRQSTGLVSQEKPKLPTTDGQNFISGPNSLNDNEYAAFVPQKQSTTLDNFSSPLSSKLERRKFPPFATASTIPEESLINGEITRTSPNKKLEGIDDRCNFAKLELAANSVANDIFNTSIELAEENEQFVSAESELFQDSTNFDFLLSKTPRKNTKRDLRALSLYVKFDPLVSDTSMLPQGNIQSASPPAKETRNGGNNTTIANIGTPKRNPAIAAIDRLLFYSPMSGNTTPTNTNTTIQNTNDTQEKLKPTQETSEETINMAKELELVRTTVLQLEEQLEKLKIDHDEALEKQTSYKEKINQLQAQLAQEIKNKNEITVVVDEYEISISRLVAERERDRKNLDLEKAKLQEELAAAKHHLDNTEAAFNDVHLKYERLKAVVTTYKSNEAALKESLQENVEIIKSLENRYEQVKSHATARLEKANQDLDEIRKQNESETVRLHAMLRKAELKSNSLAELVEQKTKENKELTQILDEVIARVGCNKSE